MKKIFTIIALIMVMVIATSCSNMFNNDINPGRRSRTYTTYEEVAGTLGDISQIISAPASVARLATGQILDGIYYGSENNVVFEGNLVEYNQVRQDFLSYVENKCMGEPNGLAHQNYADNGVFEWDSTKVYVELSTYTDMVTGEILANEIRIFTGEVLSNMFDWNGTPYAMCVMFNGDFTYDVYNHCYTGLELGD